MKFFKSYIWAITFEQPETPAIGTIPPIEYVLVLSSEKPTRGFIADALATVGSKKSVDEVVCLDNPVYVPDYLAQQLEATA